MAPDAIVFDFDGSILDTETSEYVTVAAVFAEHGLDLPLGAWQDIVGRADHRHWLDWLEDELGAPIVERDALFERRRAAHRARVEAEAVLPGVLELLDAADERGVPVAVASSSSRSWVEPHLDRLGLADRFVAVRCRDDVARAKPWPDVYLSAVDALGVAPHRAVAVEDSHHGCAAARAAGLACVVVPNPITRSQAFHHASLLVESLAELHWDVLTELVANPGGVFGAGEADR